MNISITPELEKFVQQEVKTGLYQSASEVIRAALRRLKEDKEKRKPPFVVSSKAELEEKLLEGISELDRGEGCLANRFSPNSKPTAPSAAAVAELIVAPSARADLLAQWD